MEINSVKKVFPPHETEWIAMRIFDDWKAVPVSNTHEEGKTLAQKRKCLDKITILLRYR